MRLRLNILIVDRNVVCRDTFRQALVAIPDVDVVGAAPNAKLGLERMRQLCPDLVVLDTLLPDMSPTAFTEAALQVSPQIGVLLASSLDAEAVDRTIAALEYGAFDFVIKPETSCPAATIDQLQRVLLSKIRCFTIKRYSRMARGLAGTGTIIAQRWQLMKRQEAVTAPAPPAAPQPVDMVLIGVSTGGPEALLHLLRELPATFAAPIVIVLHMPPLFTGRMAEALDRQCPLTVCEAADGDPLRPATVYLAPGGRHLTVVNQTGRKYHLCVSDQPPVNGFKPCVDVLFRSAAEAVGRRVLAIVLTGMGNDGVDGSRALKEKGARVMVQDEETSVVWGMPGSVVRAGLADEIVPLPRLAGRIVETAGGTAP